MDYLSEGGVNSILTTKEHQQMLSFLKDYHDFFSLDYGDRGETDLVEMTIKTGDCTKEACSTQDTICSEVQGCSSVAENA